MRTAWGPHTVPLPVSLKRFHLFPNHSTCNKGGGLQHQRQRARVSSTMPVCLMPCVAEYQRWLWSDSFSAWCFLNLFCRLDDLQTIKVCFAHTFRGLRTRCLCSTKGSACCFTVRWGCRREPDMEKEEAVREVVSFPDKVLSWNLIPGVQHLCLSRSVPKWLHTRTYLAKSYDPNTAIVFLVLFLLLW